MIEGTSWMQRGRCRNVPREFFYPDGGAGVARARRLCAACGVKEICLRYALDHHIADGVWGGTSERERERLQRNRRVAAHQDGVTP